MAAFPVTALRHLGSLDAAAPAHASAPLFVLSAAGYF